MIEQYADEWVTLLRSGTYTQGPRRLTRNLTAGDDSTRVYDALALLCIVMQGHLSGDDLAEVSFTFSGTTGYGWLTATQAEYNLPLRVRELTGVQTKTGIFTLDGSQTSIAILNDSTPAYTFDEIATFVEDHWEEI